MPCFLSEEKLWEIGKDVRYGHEALHDSRIKWTEMLYIVYFVIVTDHIETIQICSKAAI